MSAIIGGACIANLPYDSLYHKDNEFGDRIARNQLLVLKTKLFDKVNNPADGSYYIETLTTQLAEKHWFIQRYQSQRFSKQLNEGVIKRKFRKVLIKNRNF
jgi:methylmalonyl-CoA mutase